MAYLFARMLNFSTDFKKNLFWRGTLAILLTGSIVSNLVSANAETWWSKDLSYFNAQVSDRLNAISHPIVISDIGDDFTNTGDLISMSYRLNPDVKLLLLSSSNQNTDLILTTDSSKSADTIYVFRPSLKLLKSLKLQDPRDLVFPAGQLWKFNPS
jgi:uncharacterized membrane protein